MKRIILLVTLILCFLVPAVAEGLPFSDVSTDAWYYSDLQTAYNLGLIGGKNSTETFLPDDDMTYAEAIKLACCMHQLYNDGYILLSNGTPWYQPYVDYCLQNGIITKEYSYNSTATRSGYMEIFANALPNEALNTKNYIKDGFIPDVDMSKEYAESVYKLYRAGIVGGVDSEHNCNPDASIKRREVAVILTRMMDKSKRIELGERVTSADFDFEGKTLRIVTHYGSAEFVPTEADVATGNSIVSATDKRNREICEKYNISIDLKALSGIFEFNSYVQKTVLSGIDEFDLIVGSGLTMGALVTKNIYTNWYNIPYVDFSNPWWSRSNADSLTYNNTCLVAISDINTSAITSAAVIAFNKALADKNGLTNLYDLALDGKWTYDAMHNALKDIYVDLDSEQGRSAGDFFGAVLPTDSTSNAWLWAFDNPIVQKGEDGIPIFSIKTNKINDIVKNVFALYSNTQGIGSDKYIDGLNPSNAFANGMALMTAVTLQDIIDGRYDALEDDLCFLPYPKLNNDQANYITHVIETHSSLAVPKTARDLETIGILTEILARQSRNTVLPTIYDAVCKNDTQRKIADIVIDGRYFDFGYIYDDYQGFSTTIRMMLYKNRNNFEPYYQQTYPNARLQLKKVLRAFEK